MNFAALISNLIPVTIAGLILGAGMPALFALGMRISAGQTTRQEDGTMVQVRPATPVLRALAYLIFAVIVGIIVVGILWIAKDFIYHTMGLDLLGASSAK